MGLKKMVVMGLAVLLLSTSAAIAGDFDWLKNLDIRARADESGFRAQLSTRFKVGDADVRLVLGNVGSPADAYMVLRLGEICDKPAGYVLERYKANQGKGWGVLAKSLGIKPGSKEFHALKQGHDLHDGHDGHADHGDDKGKGKDKAKDKDKGKGHGKH
ncbi:MAG: hypothetical protein OEV28_06395 [Nitrospirota bacterium]|nr:hypothetical protein [Nitrospirota bacterium]